MDRDKIEEKYKWDLSQIFKSIDEFENAFKDAEDKIEDFSKYEKIMGDNATNFYNALKDLYEVNRLLEKLYIYAKLKHDIDIRNSENQSLLSRIENLSCKFDEFSYFIDLMVLKKDYNEIERFYSEEPKLLEYETILKEKFRHKEHVLSESEEKIMATIRNMVGSDYKTYQQLVNSKLKSVYKKSETGNEIVLANNMYELVKLFSDTFASIMSNHINKNVTLARIKKFNSTREFYLFNEGIDECVYDNLIDVVSNNLNLLYSYCDLLKQILEVDE